jgi:protein tyrosine phosphatase type 4A
VHYWPFQDGDAPPEKVINDWLDLVDAEKALREKAEDETGKQATIAVHCVAGLGRAPVLVAIALIESGMEPLDAILFIRERRKGAINSKQMRFLEQYKRRSKGKGNSKKPCCNVQ